LVVAAGMQLPARVLRFGSTDARGVLRRPTDSGSRPARLKLGMAGAIRVA